MKKFLSVVLMVVMAFSAFILPASAEIEEIDDIGDLGGNFYFLCETDKDMLSYMPGDSVIFTVKLFSGNRQIVVPYLIYTVERDDGKKNSGKVEPDGDGNYIISDYTMDVPGYVRLLVDFPNEQGGKNWSALKENQRSAFEGGVLVDVENITTVNEMPADYEDFWIDSLALLDDYSPDPIEIVPAGETGSYYMYEVYVDCYGDTKDLKSGDTFAAGYLNIPKGAKPESLPIIMQFQGYGIKGAYKTASSTAIIFNMSAHSLRLGAESYGPELFNMPVDESQNYGWSAMENKDRNKVYFRNMFLRNVQAARFLMKYFGNEEYDRKTIDGVDTSAWKGLWNGKDLQATGGSQGGFQAIAVGALCPQVSLVRASIPWGANQGAGTYSNPTGPVLGSTFSPNYAHGLDYHDSAFFAKMLNCDIVITGGMGDMTCSPANLMMIYNNAKNGKNINASITLQQGETHMFKPDPNMIKSSLAVYKNEVVDWNIENGALNVNCNGILSTDLAEVSEWNTKLDQIKEINVYGNLTEIKDGVFAVNNKTSVYLKTSTAVSISENAFGSKDTIIYLNSATELDGFAEPQGFEYHTMGTFDREGAFSYALEGDVLKIYSQDKTMSLATSSGDTALVNFAKDNADTIKKVEIHGEFVSLGNMQPVFSKLSSATSIMIDDRITALSDEKNFMGLSALVSLGHYDFIEDKTVTYSESIVNLTGFDTYIDDGGNNGVPAYILSGCKSVKAVILPNILMCGEVDVAGIVGEKALADCSSLETVEFPENVTLTSLAFGVFSKCTSLQKVIVKGEVSKNFSCVLNISTLQSFAQVPDTAVFEVGSEEFAEIINARLAAGELPIKAVSNGSFKNSAQKDSLGAFGTDATTIIIISACAVVVIAAVTTILINKKKKKK